MKTLEAIDSTVGVLIRRYKTYENIPDTGLFSDDDWLGSPVFDLDKKIEKQIEEWNKDPSYTEKFKRRLYTTEEILQKIGE
jgi:hypothetical protein